MQPNGSHFTSSPNPYPGFRLSHSRGERVTLTPETKSYAGVFNIEPTGSVLVVTVARREHLVAAMRGQDLFDYCVQTRYDSPVRCLR